MSSEEDEELRELQDPDAWDWDSAELRPAGDGGRIIVSVEFSGEEFERVGAAAEEAGVHTPQFIRQTVLAQLPARTPKR